MSRVEVLVLLVPIVVCALTVTECSFGAEAKQSTSSDTQKVSADSKEQPKARAAKKKGRFELATVQFVESFDPRANGKTIRRHIAEAAKGGADVVHFHEGALSGYGKEISDPNYDWDALREEIKSILTEAKRHRIWVIVGSAHRLTPPNKPHNSVYVISPEGKIVDRYDKRFCVPPGDLEHYSPGNHFAIFEINGVKCSVLICFDSRFPELYRELYKQKVRLVFHSFHIARRKKVPIQFKTARQILQGHAAINSMWISATNSSAGIMGFPSVFITPDGVIAKELPYEHDKPNMMINKVSTRRRYHGANRRAWRELSQQAARGKLNSGEVVKGDPKSEDRTSF